MDAVLHVAGASGRDPRLRPLHQRAQIAGQPQSADDAGDRDDGGDLRLRCVEHAERFEDIRCALAVPDEHVPPRRVAAPSFLDPAGDRFSVLLARAERRHSEVLDRNLMGVPEVRDRRAVRADVFHALAAEAGNEQELEPRVDGRLGLRRVGRIEVFRAVAPRPAVLVFEMRQRRAEDAREIPGAIVLGVDRHERGGHHRIGDRRDAGGARCRDRGRRGERGREMKQPTIHCSVPISPLRNASMASLISCGVFITNGP